MGSLEKHKAVFLTGSSSFSSGVDTESAILRQLSFTSWFYIPEVTNTISLDEQEVIEGFDKDDLKVY